MQLLPGKHFFILFSFLLCSTCLFAQDVIVFRNGKVVEGKVTEVTDETVKMKLTDNLQGPDYIYDTQSIYYICYENGKKEIFNDLYMERKFELRLLAAWDFSSYSKTWQEGTSTGIVNNHYSYRENYYSALALAGQRFSHYAYGIGAAIYLNDFKQDMNEYEWSSARIIRNEKSVDVAACFSNKLIIAEGKFSPFLLLDLSLLFPNVIWIERNKSAYNADYLTTLEYFAGAGLEIKTDKKYRYEIHAGMRPKATANVKYQQAMFHLGMGLVY
jgi:hypothetical protein